MYEIDHGIWQERKVRYGVESKPMVDEIEVGQNRAESVVGWKDIVYLDRWMFGTRT